LRGLNRLRAFFELRRFFGAAQLAKRLRLGRKVTDKYGLLVPNWCSVSATMRA
jgi:hypothetical protein